MRIYVGGPMRGIEAFNFPAFDETTARLRALGHDVSSPAEHDREMGFDPTLNDITGFDVCAAFVWDLTQVIAGDAIVLLDGWELSSGANLELSVARQTGKQVFYPGDPVPRAAPRETPVPVRKPERLLQQERGLADYQQQQAEWQSAAPRSPRYWPPGM